MVKQIKIVLASLNLIAVDENAKELKLMQVAAAMVM